MTVDNCSRHDSAWHFFSDFNAGIAVATTSKTEKPQSATSNTGISVVHSENKVDPSKSNHFHFKDNTERSIDLVKFFEAKYRECFCNHLTQLITDLENSTSIDHIVNACNSFNNNISNSTYNNTSLNGVTLSVDANIDFENSKNNLITESKDLLASYQVTVLEKQEKTEPNIELKENNVFFRFFNSVIKLLTKFIDFFQQGHMLSKLNDVIDKKKSLNDVELNDLIKKLNQTSLDKALLYSTQQGNVEILNMLVQAKANVNTKNNEYGATPLILAAVQGNVEIIDLLIKAGADINATNKYNETALNVAIWWNRYDFAKKLLEYQPDVNTADIKGYTALIVVTSRVLNNNSNDDILYEVIDEIIDKSSNEALNLQNYRGYNALHGAVSYGNSHAVKKLLERDVLVNETFKFLFDDDNQGSVLHLIIGMYDIDINKKLEIIKLLLDAGIDTNIKDSESRTALELAKLKELIVELLQKNSRHNKLNDVIDKTENLNETEVTNLIKKLNPSSLNTALIYSAEKGNVEILNRLIVAGADINAENKNGITPLIGVAEQGNLEILNRLLAAGADINAENKNGFTPLMGAAEQGNIEILNKLIAVGANVNAENKNGFTPLIGAATQGNIEIPNRLIAVEANVNAENKNGFTPLIKAIAQGNIEIIDMLVKAEADINAENKNGITPLIEAIEQGDIKILDALVKAGVDINAKDKLGQTALIRAIKKGKYAIAKRLLAYQANIDTADIYGYTALMAATSRRLNNNACDDLLYEVIDEMIDKSSTEALNIQNNKGYTALHYAVCNGNVHTVKKLLEKGVAVNGNCITDSCDNSGSHLHIIMDPTDTINIDTKFKIIRLLLDDGIDTNVKDSKGRTALELAIEKARIYPKYKLIVELLQCYT